MVILKYTPRVKELLDSETKPEPFMHVAVLKGGEHEKLAESKGWYSIFIWDNRKSLESDSYDAKNYPQLSRAAKAVDNRKPIKGSGVDVVNDIMTGSKTYISGCMGRDGKLYRIKTGSDKAKLESELNAYVRKRDSSKAKTWGTWQYTVPELKEREFVTAMLNNYMPTTDTKAFYNKHKSDISAALSGRTGGTVIVKIVREWNKKRSKK